MIQTPSRTETKTISQAQDEINVLVQKDKKLRAAIAALPKKGAISERHQLEREIGRVAKQREFWEALSRIKFGSRVQASHRKEEGVVTGFQEYASRIVAAWVCWGRSEVAMPEYPTLLKPKEEEF